VVSVDARLKREAVFRAAFQGNFGGLCTLNGVKESGQNLGACLNLAPVAACTWIKLYKA
jgi:hypothetical protein